MRDGLKNPATRPPGAPADPTLEDANAAFARGDHERAIALVLPLAESAYAPAQSALGGYLMAQEATQAEAERWLRMAAEAAYPPATHNLGVLLQLLGRYDEADAWLQRSVDLGFEGSVATDPYWWKRNA